MKFRFTSTASLFGLLFISLSSRGQSSITLSSGVSIDLNNKKPFYHIPISLQWKPFPNPGNPFTVGVEYGVPFGKMSTAKAYTANPSLPQQVILQENIRSFISTVNAGVRIFLFSVDEKNKFYLNISLGICSQNFKVNYVNFDKANYEVLNPDVKANWGGFVLSSAAVYNFHTANRDLQLRLHLQTSLLADLGRYPLSYKSVAPFQLTFGYNFYYNKNK